MTDALLEEALGAWSDQLDAEVGAVDRAARGGDVEGEPEDGEATLAAILETLAADGLLDEATRALRAESELSDEEAATLAAVQRSLGNASVAPAHLDLVSGPDTAVVTGAVTRADTEPEAASGSDSRPGSGSSASRPARASWWAAAAAAVVLLALPTAYAWSAGGLDPLLARLGFVEPTPAPIRAPDASPPEASAPESAVPESAVPESSPPEAPLPQAADLPPEDVVRVPVARVAAGPPRPSSLPSSLPVGAADRRAARGPAPSSGGGTSATRAAAPEQAPAPVADPSVPVDHGETEAFARAHRAHFSAADTSAALSAWNAYLREYPDGRYEPEARYNRALSLVRLGRLDDARRALAPFASGARAGYRQVEARRLVEALDRRIAAQRLENP